MKKFTYSADGGTIQLGNENFLCHYCNDYGDGTFSIYVINEGEMSTKRFNFQGSVKGTFNVYGYDCDTEEVLTTLTGRYGVYASVGTVVLEKWSD